MARPKAASSGNDQEKVINTTTSVKKTISNADIDKMARDAGRILKGFPLVEVLIPKRENSKDDTVEVCYNGHMILMKRGVRAKVPKPIRQLLKQSEVL